ncbi:MAG: OprD family outer membrane porin [Sulfuricurvum sp.]|nr:OprD family outer membrane porin [Sulfuricurvum sp.]
MKLVNLSIAAAAACLFATSAHALKTEDRVLKGNYQVEYTKVPGSVESFNEMFTKGEVYGRLRSNMFYWDWENEQSDQAVDNTAWGLGGSLVYKTANYKGFSSTVGFYATFPLTNEEILTSAVPKTGVKAGKDTFVTAEDGSQKNNDVLAELTLEYKIGNTEVIAGRQKVENQIVSTNDTKMIPQTFEGIVVKNKDLPQTKIELGYLTSQKLRDHDTFHSLMVAGNNDTQGLSYNDDYGRHKGIKVSTVTAAGKDLTPAMAYVMAENTSIKDLKLNAGYYQIQDYLKDVVLEANYKIGLGAWSVTPGVRYYKQIDDGAGAIGGAAIGGTVTAANAASKGYTDGDNLDGSILMARLVADNGPFNAAIGWSKVSDDADIVSQWRNFPTWGYTRLMAQLDWIANTESYMARAGYDFGKAGIIEGLDTVIGYENINMDDTKALLGGTTWSDRDVYTLDVTKTFKELPNTEFKLRVGIIDAENTQNTIHADHVSYNEYRFEMNYLF